MQLSKTKPARWHLYLIQNAQGLLYTGISTDPSRRLRQHNGELSGGAKALRGKGPFQLVYGLTFVDKPSASKAEYAVKRWSKAQKEQLCAGCHHQLARLNTLCGESLIALLLKDE